MQEKRQNFCRAIGIAAFRSRLWLDLRKARRWNDFLECPSGTACYRLAALLAKNHSVCEGKIIQRIAMKIRNKLVTLQNIKH